MNNLKEALDTTCKKVGYEVSTKGYFMILKHYFAGNITAFTSTNNARNYIVQIGKIGVINQLSTVFNFMIADEKSMFDCISILSEEFSLSKEEIANVFMNMDGINSEFCDFFKKACNNEIQRQMGNQFLGNNPFNNAWVVMSGLQELYYSKKNIAQEIQFDKDQIDDSYESRQKEIRKCLDNVLQINVNDRLKANIIEQLCNGVEIDQRYGIANNISKDYTKEEVLLQVIKNAFHAKKISDKNIYGYNEQEQEMYGTNENKQLEKILVNNNDLMSRFSDVALDINKLSEVIKSLDDNDISFLAGLYVSTRKHEKIIKNLDNVAPTLMVSSSEMGFLEHALNSKELLVSLEQSKKKGTLS
ncbi:MAG: hypothetical protein RSA10_01415 [Bacilli bacterium]